MIPFHVLRWTAFSTTRVSKNVGDRKPRAVRHRVLDGNTAAYEFARIRVAGHVSFMVVFACLSAMLSTASAQVKVDSDFPGGSGVVQEIDQDSRFIRLLPDDHPGRGWRCWWYVKLTGLTPGTTFTLEVGEAPWATPDRATLSLDGGKTWQHSEAGVRNGKQIRYELPAEQDSLLVAWGPPFVPADAAALVQRLAQSSAAAEAFVLCRTREGRETPALRVASQQNDQTGPRPLIWIQARQHAWESGASWVCRGFTEWLLSDASEARALRQQAEVVIVPIMDIDNVHRGAGGKNQSPQDHNRDWSDQPHWRAVAAAQAEIGVAAAENRLAMFIDLHNPSARDRQPYFYLPPRDMLPEQGRENLDLFLTTAKENIRGPLRFAGRVIESGPRYDPKAWKFISKNWVARLGTPAVAVTLETAWNTPHSTTDGYMTVGRQLGLTLAETIGSPSFHWQKSER